MVKKKKRRSLADEFDWYEKKDGTYTQRHRLYKHSPELTKWDNLCRELSREELCFSYQRLNREKLDYYPTYQEYLEALSKIKIAYDWYRYKTVYENNLLLEPYHLEDGCIVSRRADGTPIFYYVEIDDETGRITIRDEEGNIIDTY